MVQCWERMEGRMVEGWERVEERMVESLEVCRECGERVRRIAVSMEGWIGLQEVWKKVGLQTWSRLVNVLGSVVEGWEVCREYGIRMGGLQGVWIRLGKVSGSVG